MQLLQHDPLAPNISASKADAKELIDLTRNSVLRENVHTKQDSLKVQFPDLMSSNGGVIQIKPRNTLDNRRQGDGDPNLDMWNEQDQRS